MTFNRSLFSVTRFREEVDRMGRFLVYLEPAEEGGYIVSAPALPGCVTQGETKAEALAMIEDAIRGYIASLRKHGESLPTGHEAAEVEVVEVQVEPLP
jgi:antitoxin HicB